MPATPTADFLIKKEPGENQPRIRLTFKHRLTGHKQNLSPDGEA
jgi:hypothetical protein